MTPQFNVLNRSCPSRNLLDDVVGRWPALVLISLRDSPRRFAQTARSVDGISDRMLSHTLATLTETGLVERTADLGTHRVTYALTAAGRAIAESMNNLVETLYDVMPTTSHAIPPDHTRTPG